MRKGQSILKIK